MDAPRTVSAVSAALAEEFFTTGTQAYPAENPESCSCGGIDTPGCGRLHTSECAFRQTPPSLRRPLNNEPPALLVPQECENADDVELLAGIERNMKVLNDRRARREDLLSSLIFAARNLAERNLLPSLGAQCAECGMLRRLGRHAHTDTCKTGRVLGIIAELANTFDPKEKEAAPEEETAGVGDGIRTRGEFGEPWSPVSVDVHHQAVTIATGDGIARQYYDLCGTLPNLIPAAHRVVDCVNFCDGVPAEYLKKFPALALYEIAKREGLDVLVSRKGGAQ